MATNGSTLQNETRLESAVELPPPYSVENQPQQQNVWSPQATNAGPYPPFHYPGGNQQAPFQYHPAAVPSRAGALSEDEIRRRQETATAAIRQLETANVVIHRRIVVIRRRSCAYRLTRLGIVLFLAGVTLLVVLGGLVVRPALYDMQLKSAQCTAISSNYRDEKKCYRCLRILVSYYANGKKQTAYLYENVNAQKNKVRIIILRIIIIIPICLSPLSQRN